MPAAGAAIIFFARGWGVSRNSRHEGTSRLEGRLLTTSGKENDVMKIRSQVESGLRGIAAARRPACQEAACYSPRGSTSSRRDPLKMMGCEGPTFSAQRFLGL